MPTKNQKDDAKDKPRIVEIDTKAPAAPDIPYRPGEVGSWDGFGAVDKRSDSDQQPPVEPAGEDEPSESFRDPVKEGV